MADAMKLSIIDSLDRLPKTEGWKNVSQGPADASIIWCSMGAVDQCPVESNGLCAIYLKGAIVNGLWADGQRT
ncbi:hypothetical protein K523DRAFT_359004 [Schizophyllum commune Tattone D]|nr:hypothetical protein K523DRAFT_359004 [Schizophyllum commune Tattone D]